MSTPDPDQVMAEHDRWEDFNGSPTCGACVTQHRWPCATYLLAAEVKRLRETVDLGDVRLEAVRRLAASPNVYVLSTDDVLHALRTCKHGRAVCFAASCTAPREGEQC